MLTRKAMMALPFHPSWDDGRVGFIWCRFDAIVTEENWLRAEVTWEDEHQTRYFHPILKLESNRKVGEELRTIDFIDIDLTEEEAKRIVAEPASELLERYAQQFARLRKA